MNMMCWLYIHNLKAIMNAFEWCLAPPLTLVASGLVLDYVVYDGCELYGFVIFLYVSTL